MVRYRKKQHLASVSYCSRPENSVLLNLTVLYSNSVPYPVPCKSCLKLRHHELKCVRHDHVIDKHAADNVITRAIFFDLTKYIFDFILAKF